VDREDVAVLSSRLALAGLLGLLVAGCGEDAEPDATPQPESSDASSPATAAPDLTPYLLQSDELLDLEPVGSPQTMSGEPFELTERGADVLERSGYVGTTYQPAVGTGAAGVSSVLLFESKAGAEDWMAFETSREALEAQVPDARITRFRVAGLPGATGWTGPDLHGNAIGNVYWTQGRCMLLVSLEVEGPRKGPLSSAARSIRRRTGATCP
jgi:hypothetical protein